MSYEEALDKTDPLKSKTVTNGSVDEKAAIERFKDFYAVFTPENVLAGVRDVYAKDAYLTDALKELNDIEDIEAYMLRLLKSVESCTFEFLDVAVSGGEYYFRWVSEAKPKTIKKGRTMRLYGMSHIRFDETGKVVFHVDYWDSAGGIFEHIPVLGGLIKLIKRRI
jgi:hypothetical protein